MSVNTSLPSGAAGDNTASQQLGRTTGYQESIVAPVFGRDMWSVAEGSRYVAVNPTAGTGILGHAAPTTFDETKAFLYLYNGGSRTIYPQMLRLIDTVVSVGGTRIQFNQTIDVGNKLSSGGTTLTKSNLNMGSGNTSGAVITAGAAVLSAATGSRRLLGNQVIKGANIDVVWDQFEFVWGTTGGSSGGALTPTTVAQQFTQAYPPVAIPPTYGMAIYLWAASMSTGPTFEVIFDYIER